MAKDFEFFLINFRTINDVKKKKYLLPFINPSKMNLLCNRYKFVLINSIPKLQESKKRYLISHRNREKMEDLREVIKMSLGYTLNPNASSFEYIPGEDPWNASAIAFVPFLEPKPVEIAVEVTPVQICKKVYTFDELFSLREAHRTLPEGTVVPEFYSKGTRSKSKNTKKHPQPSKPAGIKRAENQLNTLMKVEKPLMQKIKQQTDELEKKSREIRSILNKLTEKNFEKMSNELISFEYTDKLLGNLTNFVFERATSMNFPDLYAKLCKSLRQTFKTKQLANGFRKAIVEKCRECFYNENTPLEADKLMEAEFKRRRRLIGNIKFIALLHKEKMIKSEIMFECFSMLLEPKSLSDETLETCITLFKDTCPMLISNFSEQILEYYEKLIGFHGNNMFCKRVLFMLQDLIEAREKIIPQKVPKKRKNSKANKNKAVAAAETLSIENLKELIKDATKTFVENPLEVEWKSKLDSLIKKYSNSQLEVIIQVLKYGLYEYFTEHEMLAVCELTKIIIDSYSIEEILIEKAIKSIQVDLSEITIDSPKAEENISVILNFFKVGLSDVSKRNIRELLRIYVKGAEEDEWRPKMDIIVNENIKSIVEVVVQTLKYALYEFANEENIEKTCELVIFFVKTLENPSGILEKALESVQADLGEITIDSPRAQSLFPHAQQLLHL